MKNEHQTGGVRCLALMRTPKIAEHLGTGGGACGGGGGRDGEGGGGGRGGGGGCGDGGCGGGEQMKARSIWHWLPWRWWRHRATEPLVKIM